MVTVTILECRREKAMTAISINFIAKWLELQYIQEAELGHPFWTEGLSELSIHNIFVQLYTDGPLLTTLIP